MPLANGSRFGPYQVTAQLGEGGMGEVYRARDTRLGRDVALKVLHGDVAQSADRRARFEREAKAVAGLNHPNIVALFDIGEENDVVYFVSELVEGETLRDRISRGALPVRELLDIAVQTADGLSAAHAAGITHRDLKPENVMLTRDGRVKILDFGLARQAPVAKPAQDRTVTINETQPGAVLGTANYMSPEQVRGIAVDYRSDQFSFGIILYEMATGKQAFHRESAILTMSAVVTDEPPVMDAAVQAKLPPPLRWTMNRCLAKEVPRRYESTRDLYEDLRAQREHLTEAYSSGALPALPDVKAPQAPQASGKIWKIASGVLLLGVLGLVLALVMSRSSTGGLENYKFTPFAVSSEGQRNPIWSTDGKAAAYLGEVEGHDQLFVRYLNAQVPVQLTTTGVSEVFCWSQDSRRIFFSGKNPNSGGPGNAIFSIAAVGGDPEQLMAVDYVTADVSPDGKALAVLVTDKDGYQRLQISSPIGSPLKPFPSTKFASNSQINARRLRFSPDGRKVLLLQTDSVNGRWTERRWLIPYPAESGEPREVLTNLPQSSFTPVFSWAPDSRHIVLAFPAHVGAANNLWMADTASKSLRRLTSTTTNENSPSVSPDGKRILYQESRFDLDIAKVTLTDGKVIRLIATEEDETMPYWAAKGGKFVYVTTRNGPPEIWMRSEDGADRPVVTPADFTPAPVNFFMNPSLTPDGDRVVYTMGEVGGKALLYISSTSGGSPTRVTNSDTGIEVAAGLSPDGKQAVYFEIGGSKGRLMLVKTSGQATPSFLRDDINNSLPQWSPTGEWISTRDSNGWHLISPDGKKVRDLGKLDDGYLSFSIDGKRLYGIRREKEHQYLHYFEVAGEGKPVEKIVADIGKDYGPSSKTNPSYRISMAPDGTCAIYSIATAKSSIWLFDGF